MRIGQNLKNCAARSQFGTLAKKRTTLKLWLKKEILIFFFMFTSPSMPLADANGSQDTSVECQIAEEWYRRARALYPDQQLSFAQFLDDWFRIDGVKENSRFYSRQRSFVIIKAPRSSEVTQRGEVKGHSFIWNWRREIRDRKSISLPISFWENSKKVNCNQ
ncbi:MAG: hypothetical protein AAF965_07930 [Pseudomonadota bacterium]